MVQTTGRGGRAKAWAGGAPPLAALLFVAAGCGGASPPQGPCTLQAVAGLRVEVVRAGDGVPLGTGATVTASNGVHTETLERMADGAFVGLWEMEGTFTVGVTREGYEPWAREVTVDVDAAHCHVVMERVTAELEPEGPGAAAHDTGATAAVAVLSHYYALLDAGRYAEAWRMWGDGGRRSGQTEEAFAAGFAHTTSTAVKAGPPGRVEGAAGSRYVRVPVEVRATTDTGEAQRFEGSYTLRRAVVDGANVAQRSWHLEDAELHRVH